MLVIRADDVGIVSSSHDPISVVAVKRMLKASTLPKMEEGKLPFFNLAFLAPGKAFTPHHHGEDEDVHDSDIGMSEVFFIVSGSGIFLGGDSVETVSKYDLIYVPRGEIHSLRNLSKKRELVYICFGISTGGGTFTADS